MSKVILYGMAADKRILFANKLLKKKPDHRLIHDWDGVSAIEANTIVSTDLMPPFAVPLDCLVVGVGVPQCARCEE